MRSGTTRLQRLLALHPGLVHLRLFEINFPVPPRGRVDLRPHMMHLLLAAGRATNPQVNAIHPMRARDADEELGLLEQSFWGAQLEAQRPIPSYARWCEGADAAPAYAHLARLLRLIGGARGDPEDTPWLLKTPQHMANLPALYAQFPGARVIVTHRDPVRVVASSASLAWHSMVLQTDRLDPHWVGREWLHKTAQRLAAVAAFRARPDAPAMLDLDLRGDGPRPARRARPRARLRRSRLHPRPSAPQPPDGSRARPPARATPRIAIRSKTSA